MSELAFKIEQNKEDEFDLEKFLSEKNIAPEIQEVINKYDYLPEALKQIVEKLDEYQVSHAVGVAEKCLFLSKEIGLSEKDTDKVIQASFLHDIGKAADDEMIHLVTSDEKFSKDKDGEEKRDKINEHPDETRKWCKQRSVPKDVMYIAVGHHEYKDNKKSYPRQQIRAEVDDNLKKLKNIFSLVDRYDAWKNKRFYKEAMSLEDCEKEMKNNDITLEEDKEIIRILLKNDLN